MASPSTSAASASTGLRTARSRKSGRTGTRWGISGSPVNVLRRSHDFRRTRVKQEDLPVHGLHAIAIHLIKPEILAPVQVRSRLAQPRQLGHQLPQLYNAGLLTLA